MKTCISNHIKSLSCLALVAAVAPMACSSGDDSSTGGTAGTATAAGSTTATNTAVATGSTTSNATSATGSAAATGGVSSGTGGTSSTTAGTTSTATGGSSSTTTSTSVISETGCTDGTYDCDISAGEFSQFVISLDYILANHAGSCTASNIASTGCAGALGGNLGGLAGADAMCAQAAQAANPGDTHLWRAYLSTSTVDAIDRVGTGPWYTAPSRYQIDEYSGGSNYGSDGLLFANNTSGLTTVRGTTTTTKIWYGVAPTGGGTATEWPLGNCVLDEYGICGAEYDDTHDVMTGSNQDGTYSGKSCSDWTSTSGNNLSIGHMWPRRTSGTIVDGSQDADYWVNEGSTESCGLGLYIGSQMNGSTAGVGSMGGYGAWYCFAYSI